MRRLSTFLCLLAAAYALSNKALADLKPEKVRVADSKKNLSYIKDGLFIGGDKAIDEVVIKDIRRAPNTGFERVVIDLEGTRNGEPVAIQRPPYYQLSVTPDEKRLVFTIWGKPKLAFDSGKVIAAFKKSAVVQNVVLLPRIEDTTWTFVFELKGESPVEVFELSNPVRVIMDIKSTAAHAAPVAHAPKHAHSSPHGKKAAQSHPDSHAAPHVAPHGEALESGDEPPAAEHEPPTAAHEEGDAIENVLRKHHANSQEAAE